MVFLEFISFVVAAVLLFVTAAGWATLALWGGFFVALGLSFHALHELVPNAGLLRR